MYFKKIIVLIFVLAKFSCAIAQHTKSEIDSIYIQRTEVAEEPVKVFHAEPLYIDLIRDLGARKGEREWNLGLGMADNLSFDSYEALVEYEWAPIHRLGLEVELPFTFYTHNQGGGSFKPANRLNSIKIATQWSFFVNERLATSMAIGYINEFELSDFKNFGSPLITGNIYNPFLVVAKRWGTHFHSLIYTGPMIAQHFETNSFHTTYDVNTSFHYMISGTRNFIGVEFNKTFDGNDFDMTIRPQMRVGVAENLLIGIIAGIPVKRENERLSSFIRLIWEPKERK